MDSLVAEPQDTSNPESSAVWGPLATLLWTALLALAFLIVQIVAAGAYIIVTMREVPRAKVDAALAALQFDSRFLAVCTFSTLLICTPLIVGIAKLKRGSNLTDYLGLILPRARQFLGWSIITIVFGTLVDLILSLLHQNKIPEFMVKVYGSNDTHWPLWLAVVVGAPIMEEIAFRGFIFKGLAMSRLHWYGATLITSVLWAGIHLQYDWYEISVIFGLGLVLGTARALTNSILLTMWLHCLVNILASVQIATALK